MLIKVIKLRMIWPQHVARMGRLKFTRDGDLGVMVWKKLPWINDVESVDYFGVHRHEVQWLFLIRMTRVRLPEKVRNLLKNWESVNVWRGKISMELSRVKGKVVPVLNYLSTTPWGRMGEWMYNPHVLYLGIIWRWVVSFTPRPVYPRYPMDRRLGWPQSPCGRNEEVKILRTYRDSNSDPWVVQPAASRCTDWAADTFHDESCFARSAGAKGQVQGEIPPHFTSTDVLCGTCIGARTIFCCGDLI
jgi:hypothetical protein